VLGADGIATIVTRGGVPVSSFETGVSRAGSLRPGRLVVLTRGGRLDVYSTADGKRVRSWAVPLGTTGVDLHYGVALLKTRRDVFAMNVHTGKTARLFRASGQVFADLEGPGAAIAYNDHGHGRIRFVPMSSIEARTR
jgi:hypothetical protein